MQLALLASGNEESVQVDLRSGRFILHRLNLVQISGPTFSPDGKLLLVSSGMGHVRIFDSATYRETAKLSGFKFGAHGIGFSPDQPRLAIGSTAHEAVTLFDAHNHERLLTLAAPTPNLFRMTFSPDGNVLAGESGSGASAGTLHFWRAPSWAVIEKAEAAERPAPATP